MALLRHRKPAPMPTSTHYSNVTSTTENWNISKSLLAKPSEIKEAMVSANISLKKEILSQKVQKFLNNFAIPRRGRWLLPLRRASKGQRWRWISISIQWTKVIFPSGALYIIIHSYLKVQVHRYLKEYRSTRSLFIFSVSVSQHSLQIATTSFLQLRATPTV